MIVRFVTVRMKTLALVFAAVLAVLAAAASVEKAVTTAGDVQDGLALPIIMYHSVLKDASKSGKYVITPDAFERDLKFLQSSGYTAVFMSDVIDYVKSGKDLPPKPIVLTFDDGHLNNETYILPLLEKYNQKAVISIVGEYTQRFSDSPDENPNYAYMSWKNVREVIDSGRVEIQNHSYNMHSLGRRKGTHKIKGESSGHYRSEFVSDVERMQKACRENLGYVPNVFTYPFGSISLESCDYLKEIGFSATLSCGEGMNYITDDPECLFLLKRCIRTDSRSVEQILNEM